MGKASVRVPPKGRDGMLLSKASLRVTPIGGDGMLLSDEREGKPVEMLVNVDGETLLRERMDREIIWWV